ncbi:CotH kinase family protein [Myxococcota bacterium]|nr:CotH kinase family protein [Myxococcota bacterium]
MTGLLPLLILACADPPWSWPATTWQDPGVAPLPPDTGTEAAPPAAVVLNELMPDNESTVEDERGREGDWVELLSVAERPIDLAGWGLGDDPDAAPAWTFPAGTVLDPGQRLLLWLDDDPEAGALHLPMKLDEDGGVLVLRDAAGQEVDRLSWDSLPADVVRGRFPDGGPVLADSVLATPGNPNPYDPGLGRDPSELLFPQDRVLEVELFLPQASMDALEADPYTYVEGAVAVGGVTLSPVGVRIKGQWGSLRDLSQKAAFKVSMDAFGGTAELRGLENLTLNNMVQDPSLVHERLAYTLFRSTDVPAPRTAHVALFLNGEYRGLYLHVETADDTFLSRWYDNPDGNLYEGEYGQDLTLGSYLDLDHDERGADDPDDYSDLAALAALLAQDPSEELVDELEALVDVDEVMAALAGEVILGHWDGYFWYPNNYRVYHDPDSGRFSLLPWGLDQTFGYEGDIEGANGALARWCLQVPSLRARYLRALWRSAEVMEQLPLSELAQDDHARVLPYFRAGAYEEHSVATSQAYLTATLDFLSWRADDIVGQLFPEGLD